MWWLFCVVFTDRYGKKIDWTSKKSLSYAELLNIVDNFLFEDIPDDLNFQTDKESDDDEALINSNNAVPEPSSTLEVEDVTQSIESGIREDVEVNSMHEIHLSQQNEAILDRKWRRREITTASPEYMYPTRTVEDNFAGCETGTDIFICLLGSIIDDIVYQSNLYAVQRNKVLNLKKDELITFLGLNIFMGHYKLPNWRHYWSNSEDLKTAIVPAAMSRDRFDAILSNLHINDNTNINTQTQDKLYKIRPMIDKLNENFSRYYKGTRELSVDESIILFKGRSSLKQYNPLKPIKRG
ncbi:piggyBac transposable element-derived protein 3-like [Diabrotica virgifera virgifera]|uniref:PiggyBac transposable element-derived protein domain-containing protein n=1 Tax=Diabrotica virgifera virgifera TaxID=50390 RepID=A0ABM5L186_DIAVI|nr:piggyBac transposable element-derived protein 3-like [Diabrotica virgifera virgifera]